jgi:hypothetical protein
MIHIRNDFTDIAKFTCAYNSLVSEKGWKIKSQRNKAKIKKFTIDNNRSVSVQVYPRGKIVIAIKCSLMAFDLSSADSSREFFETLGIIHYQLMKAFGKKYILTSTGEWLLKQYDRDVTLAVTSDLERKYPYIRNWYSKEGVRIAALGHLFQIYGKIMPTCGRCLRFEENVSINGDISVEQAVKEAINRPFEIINLLQSAKGKIKGKKR